MTNRQAIRPATNQRVREECGRVECLRVEELRVEELHKASKADSERRMVTPWHSKIVGGLKALSMLLLARSSYSAPPVQNWELLGYLGNQARLLCGYSASVLRRLCVGSALTTGGQSLP
jgi:hypothetical protein